MDLFVETKIACPHRVNVFRSLKPLKHESKIPIAHDQGIVLPGRRVAREQGAPKRRGGFSPDPAVALTTTTMAKELVA